GQGVLGKGLEPDEKGRIKLSMKARLARPDGMPEEEERPRREFRDRGDRGDRPRRDRGERSDRGERRGPAHQGDHPSEGASSEGGQAESNQAQQQQQ
ncbi:MAG: polyribonucleotide nucleotidyltransferase, partial [Burkholderiaceae bacterium]